MRRHPLRSLFVLTFSIGTLGLAPGLAAATSPPADPAATVPEGATFDQLVEAARQALGPTTDVLAELAPFVPDEIAGWPTPPDAVITGFIVNPRTDFFSNAINFSTSASLPDVATLYRDAAATLGMDPIEDMGDDSTLNLQFAIPNATYEDAHVWAMIQASDTGTTVHFEVVRESGPEVLARVSGWATGMPIPPADGVSDANFGVRTTDTGTLAVHGSIGFVFAEPLTAEALQAQVEAALPAGGYAIDPAANPIALFTQMTHDGFITASLSYTPRWDQGVAVPGSGAYADVTFEVPA